MEYLDEISETLIRNGAVHTAREIAQQPGLWQKIAARITENKTDLQLFLKHALANSGRIILTGAGTSAFIGLSLRGIFQRNTNLMTEAISTTDIVSNPNDYFHSDTPTLMISFARSGNSPESAAAVSLADQICHSCYHLIITCNATGTLARHPSKGKKYVFILPEEANDQSLAMTSSYSGMLLAGILIARIQEPESTKKGLDLLVNYGETIIGKYVRQLKHIAEVDFKRAVFLGSGPFFGTATEAHLKVQELTNGRVIGKNDTFLGFRHGPKAVVDESTLVMYFFSGNPYALKYEKDLVASMRKGTPPMLQIGVGEHAMPELTLDHFFYLSDNGKSMEVEELLSVCYILPAQILGFFKSLKLGLQPDAPSVNGAITRVVEGVRIYSMTSVS
jgi:tagatose-6-phosphate ketose/aldose isomerase